MLVTYRKTLKNDLLLIIIIIIIIIITIIIIMFISHLQYNPCITVTFGNVTF